MVPSGSAECQLRKATEDAYILWINPETKRRKICCCCGSDAAAAPCSALRSGESQEVEWEFILSRRDVVSSSAQFTGRRARLSQVFMMEWKNVLEIFG